jgi:hypothetical protein
LVLGRFHFHIKSKKKLVYDFIRRHFKGKVICPNKHLGVLDDKKEYAKTASKADNIFVWSESNHAELSKGCYQELEAFMLSCSIGQPILVELKGKSISIRWIVTIDEYDDPTYFEYGWVESVHLSTTNTEE